MLTKISLKNIPKLIKITNQKFYPFDFPPQNNTVDHSKFQSLLNNYNYNLCFLKPPNPPPNLTDNNFILIVIISIISYYFYKKN